MTVSIPRSPTDPCKDRNAPAPSWWPLDPERCGGDAALVKCVNGHVTSLNQDIHRVAEDGTVSPSYVCTIGDCNWHVFIRLEQS